MTEFTKSERQQLRKLAGAVYEAELAASLEGLAASLAQWRAAEILPSELLERIHEFHQGPSRQIWATYQALPEAEIVARGLARGYLSDAAIAAALREKLQPLLAVYLR